MPDTWPTPRIWVAGERVSAAKINEISTGLGVLYPFTTGGDFVYRDPAGNYLSRLGLGALHTFLRGGASVPSYGALVYKRKGGNATNWEATGTTTYTPTKTLIEVRAVTVSYTSGVGSQAITYENTFSERPIVIPAANNSLPDIIPNYSDNSTTGCTIRVRNVAGGNGSVDVMVLIIGA